MTINGLTAYLWTIRLDDRDVSLVSFHPNRGRAGSKAWGIRDREFPNGLVVKVRPATESEVYGKGG